MEKNLWDFILPMSQNFWRIDALTWLLTHDFRKITKIFGVKRKYLYLTTLSETIENRNIIFKKWELWKNENGK